MADDAVVRRRVQRTGLILLHPADGLAGLSTVLSALCDPHTAAPVAAVVPVDWSTFLRPSAVAGSVPAFFAEVAAEAAATAVPTSSPAAAPRNSQQPATHEAPALPDPHPAAAPATEAAIQAVVLEVAHSVLGVAPQPDQPLMEAGLDSLGARWFWWAA